MAKMKVKVLTPMAGPDLRLRVGDEHEGDAKEMARWCERGIAEPLKQSKKRTATKHATESAVIQ